MAASQTGSPPYLSYRTFRNFLDSLGARGVPNRIDPSVMPSKSGTTQTLLLGAFRYLALVSDKGITAPELRRLAEVEGTERRNLWRKVLAKAYPAFFASNFNLETATFDEFAEVFRNEVSSQDTIRKCVTFLQYAAKDAGIKISPHVKPYAGTRASTQQARPPQVQSQRSRARSRTDSNKGNGPPDFKLLLDKFPEFDPNWSAEKINNWLSGLQGVAIIAGDGKLGGGISAVEGKPDEDPDDERQLTLW